MNYDAPIKLPDGRYYVKISKESGGKVLKQLNSLEFRGDGCYQSIGVSESISPVDTEIINKAVEKSETWFNKSITKEVLETMFESSVNDGVFEASLIKSKGKVSTIVYDQNKSEIPMSEFKPGTKCDIIVELSGIWFLRRNFGAIWRIVQIRVKSSKPKVYLFEDDSTPDDDDEAVDEI